jgi:hypothetical protein
MFFELRHGHYNAPQKLDTIFGLFSKYLIIHEEEVRDSYGVNTSTDIPEENQRN